MYQSLRAGMFVALVFPGTAGAFERPEVERAITAGVTALRAMQERDGSWDFGAAESTAGSTALGGLTLLMCGASNDDRQVTAAAAYVRGRSVNLSFTYSIALTILFLDKLGDPDDLPLIESLAARLVAGQNSSTGGWSYDCPIPVAGEQRRLTSLVANGRPGKNDSPKTEKPRQVERDFQQRASLLTSKSVTAGPFTRPDNSNTQFAVLALWVSRRYGFPVDSALRMAERHFRNTQNPDGGWGYLDNSSAATTSTATMTCAGLLGVSVGLGVNNDKAKEKGKVARDPGKDATLKSGLIALSRSIDIPQEKIFATDFAGPPPRNAIPGPGVGPGGGRRVGALRRRGGAPGGANPAGKIFYYLWSLERVGVALNLETIGKKDWYAWGSEIILASQDTDGAWEGNYGAGGVDTCFALLFLKRANLVTDLSALMKQVHDPGQVVLRSGDAKSGDAKEERASKPAAAAAPMKSAAAPGTAKDVASKPGTAENVTKSKTAPAAVKDERPIKPASATSSAKTEMPTAPVERTPPAGAKESPLGEAGGAKLAAALLALIPEERDLEIERLRNQKGADNTEALAIAAPYLNPEQRRKAREALAEREGRMNAETVGRDLSDENAEIRRAAALACAFKETKQFIPQLIKLLDDPETTVSRAAYAALKSMSGQDFGPAASADAADRKRASAEWQEWWKKQPH